MISGDDILEELLIGILRRRDLLCRGDSPSQGMLTEWGSCEKMNLYRLIALDIDDDTIGSIGILESEILTLLEFDDDRCLFFREAFSCSQIEGNPLILGSIRLETHRDKCLHSRIRCHIFLLQVSSILTKNDIFSNISDRERLEDLSFCLSDTLSREVIGSSHEDECEHLEEMILYHISEGSGRLIVCPTIPDRERFTHGDLDIVDIMMIPYRLEKNIGKPKCEDILYSSFRHIVIDTIDLLFRKKWNEGMMERSGTLEISTEWLLENDTSMRKSRTQSSIPEEKIIEECTRNREIDDHLSISITE